MVYPEVTARSAISCAPEDERVDQQMSVSHDVLLIRQEIALLSRDIESLRNSTGKDFETLCLSMTVRLGSMLVVGIGLMLAAMKLWVAG